MVTDILTVPTDRIYIALEAMAQCGVEVRFHCPHHEANGWSFLVVSYHDNGQVTQASYLYANNLNRYKYESENNQQHYENAMQEIMANRKIQTPKQAKQMEFQL